MTRQYDIYIELLEYAFDSEGSVKLEIYKPSHSHNCKEFYIKGISLGAPNGRYEWSCTADCPTNGISPSVISGLIEAAEEYEEED